MGKYLSYLGVHFNHHVVLLCKLVMPLVHDAPDPVCKRLTSNSIEDIDSPLPWYSASILSIREVGIDLGEVFRLRQDVIKTEALVLGTEEVGDLAALHIYRCRY